MLDFILRQRVTSRPHQATPRHGYHMPRHNGPLWQTRSVHLVVLMTYLRNQIKTPNLSAYAIYPTSTFT